MDGPPNLLLLSIDALRADHVSAWGYDRNTTQTLDAFAENNIQYTRAFAPSSHTREAAPPLLTGLWPETFAANGFRQVDGTLPETLDAHGYRTGAFHSNPYLSRAYGYDNGFAQFYDDLYLARHKFLALAQKALDRYVFNRGEYYARADEINSRALDWIDSLDDGPFVLWNHYMDVHGPYHAPETHFATESLSAGAAETLYRKAWERPEDITAAERQLLRDSYDDEIRYVDRELGSFLDALADRDLLEETLVVITADHGEVFGEHGQYTHPRRLQNQLLHVPLLVSTPSGASARVTAPASTIDIAPTTASFAGVEADLPGTALADETGPADIDEDRHVFASVAPEDDDQTRRFAVRTTDVLLRQARTVGSNEVVDERADTFCRDDTDELDSILPDLRASLDSFAQKRLREMGRLEATAEPDTTGEIESRLEALGYK
jgi:arylsulfatase A-like enzyme